MKSEKFSDHRLTLIRFNVDSKSEKYSPTGRGTFIFIMSYSNSDVDVICTNLKLFFKYLFNYIVTAYERLK